MRKIISILFLLSFITPFILSYAVLQYQKGVIKREVKKKLLAQISRDELVMLKFHKEEINTKLHWEHSREFEYQDEMFDIVETESSSDSVFYWCWWDHEETKLNNKLNELIAFALTNNPKNRENQKRFENLIKSLYFSEIKPTIIKSYYNLTITYLNQANIPLFLYYPPPTPPPKFC